MQHRRSPNLPMLFLYDAVLSELYNQLGKESNFISMQKILNILAVKIAAKYYKKVLYVIKDDEHVSDFMDDPVLVLKDQHHDDHVYHFADGIDINIMYSIPIVRKLAGKEHERYMPFKDLKKLLDYDMEQSREEMDILRQLIVRKQKHDSQFLIIMYHVPNGNWLLLDGRHRFIEYEKFQPNAERVPVLVVDSEMLSSAIINKNGFIAYCIQHNGYILQEYPMRMWKSKLWKIHELL